MAGKITALVAQKRNKERVNVYIDGEFAFGLALIEALKLKKGQVLTDEDITRLKSLDEIEVAHQRALNFLSYRPRSMQEVARNLKDSKKEFSAYTIDTVLERLERSGLVDDAAFARFWVENRANFSPRSARALRYELRQKGVSDRVIDAALDALNEDTAAYQAAQSRANRYATADEETFRKKLGGFLSRRGFSYATVRDALDRLWAELHEDDAPTSPTYDPTIDGEA